MVSGNLLIDKGAMNALLGKGSSLLEVGVVEVQGEFGISYSAQRPVADLLLERIPATIATAGVGEPVIPVDADGNPLPW